MKQTIQLSEKELSTVICECVNNILENNKHNEEYVEKAGKKDRHKDGYYKEYREKKKQEKQQDSVPDEQPKTAKPNKKDRHRKGYYKEYNKAHPERLERGFTKGYVDGMLSHGKERNNIYVDRLGIAHSMDYYNPTLTDLIDDRDNEWHDDDWYEGWND